MDTKSRSSNSQSQDRRGGVSVFLRRFVKTILGLAVPWFSFMLIMQLVEFIPSLWLTEITTYLPVIEATTPDDINRLSLISGTQKGKSDRSPLVLQAIESLKVGIIKNNLPDVIAEISVMLSNAERSDALSAVSSKTLIASLADSADATSRQVADKLTRLASGFRDVSYAGIKKILDSSGFAQETRISYLAIYNIVRGEFMTKLFSGAINDINFNASATNVFEPSSLAFGINLSRITLYPEWSRDSGSATIKGQISGWFFDKIGSGFSSGLTSIRVWGEDWQRLAGIVADAHAQEPPLSPEGAAVTHPSNQIAEWTGGRQLRIEGRWVYVNDDGTFETRLPANVEGQVSASIILIDDNGNIKKSSLLIPTAKLRDVAKTKLGDGRKIAVLFANSSYNHKDIPKLDTPGQDVIEIARLLSKKFGYQTRVINNSTKKQMVRELWKLHDTIKSNDYIIIYYAGHGYGSSKSGVGFWLPVDAETSSARNWISTVEISKMLGRISAKQILVMTDSCYSGVFAKDKFIHPEGDEQELDALKGKRVVVALSSGGDEPVSDGEVNSPFARAMINELERLKGSVNGEVLYQYVRDEVSANMPQTPQYGVITSAGYDSGGDFVLSSPIAEVGRSP